MGGVFGDGYCCAEGGIGFGVTVFDIRSGMYGSNCVCVSVSGKSLVMRLNC